MGVRFLSKGKMMCPYCDCLKSPRSKSAIDYKNAAVLEKLLFVIGAFVGVERVAVGF